MTAKDMLRSMEIFTKYTETVSVQANGQCIDVRLPNHIVLSADDVRRLAAMGWIDETDGSGYFYHNLMAVR